MTTFLSNREIYSSVVCGIVPQARERLWIATADIKDMHVDAAAATFAPSYPTLCVLCGRKQLAHFKLYVQMTEKGLRNDG